MWFCTPLLFYNWRPRRTWIGAAVMLAASFGPGAAPAEQRLIGLTIRFSLESHGPDGRDEKTLLYLEVHPR